MCFKHLLSKFRISSLSSEKSELCTGGFVIRIVRLMPIHFQTNLKRHMLPTLRNFHVYIWLKNEIILHLFSTVSVHNFNITYYTLRKKMTNQDGVI